MSRNEFFLWIIVLALVACVTLACGSGDTSQGITSDICNSKANDFPDCVTPPHMTDSPGPKYPDNERKAGHEGDVELQVVVGTDGATHDISVARSLSHDFDKAAIEAVKMWTFTPAKRNGEPIPFNTHIEVGFHLRR